MASATGLSQTAVSRCGRSACNRIVRSFKLSSDPLFVEKVSDIVGLYMGPPLMAMVLCVDEKSQIQTLDRTQLLLAARPGHPRATYSRLHALRHHHAVRGARHRHRIGHWRDASAPVHAQRPARSADCAYIFPINSNTTTTSNTSPMPPLGP